MDTEKVKRLNELLTAYKQLRENDSVQGISFLTGDKSYGVENNPEFIRPE